MRQTILRCHFCGHALEWKRRYSTLREPTEICFCLPLRGQPEFCEIKQPRELTAPALNIVQRE